MGSLFKPLRLIVPDNIAMLPLPPYAPELNPMENVWEYLRANQLSRLVWDSYDAIVEACKTAWDFLVNDPKRIASIGTRAWACVNVEGGWYKTSSRIRTFARRHIFMVDRRTASAAAGLPGRFTIRRG